MAGHPNNSDDGGAEERAPEMVEARLRARKALKLLIRCYLFGAAVTFILLLLSADRGLGQLVLDTLFWPHTLGEIAQTARNSRRPTPASPRSSSPAARPGIRRVALRSLSHLRTLSPCRAGTTYRMPGLNAFAITSVP